MGMVTLSAYRVVYFHDNAHHDDYTLAWTAQEAVDKIRERYSDLDGLEIVEVSRVVNNWR